LIKRIPNWSWGVAGAVLIAVGYFAFKPAPVAPTTPGPAAETPATFGWRPDADEVGRVLATMPRPLFADAGASLAGTWDGSPKCLWDASLKVLGRHIPTQFQPRGTCVSRGYSAALNYLQAVAIAQGEANEWKNISHSFIYGMGKEVGNDLGRQNLTSRGDGLVGAWGAKAVTLGNLTDDEAGDTDSTDDVAIRWAVSGVPAQLKEKAKPRLVRTTSLVTSFRQAADSISNGYPVVVCSLQAFHTTRDADGFCRARYDEVWPHCMCFIGVAKVNGRNALCCLQSWGETPPAPTGPTTLNQPPGSFWVEEAVADSMLRGDPARRSPPDSYAVSNFVGFRSRKIDWFAGRPRPTPAAPRAAVAEPFELVFHSKF
jgi:hypothetical protein